MRKIVITGPPPVQILDIAGPLEVFAHAPGYDITLATPGATPLLQTNRGFSSPTPSHSPKSPAKSTPSSSPAAPEPLLGNSKSCFRQEHL
jgi:hypothetical protein